MIKTSSISLPYSLTDMYNSNSPQYVSFNIPAHSEILNFIIDNNYLILLYSEGDGNMKNININIVKGTNINTYISTNYKYYTTIEKKITKIEPFVSGPNINLNSIDYSEYFHIFVEEIITLAEKRDKTLSEII